MVRVLLVAALVIVAWVVFGVVIFLLFGKDGVGPFGDTFGVLNTLFSGLAMAGVVVAIFMQKEELHLQREELKRSVKAQQVSGGMLELTAKINVYSSLIAVREGKLTRGMVGSGEVAVQSEIDEYAWRLERVLRQIEGAG